MTDEQTPTAGPLTAESVKLLKRGDWLLCEFGEDRFGVTRSAFQFSHTTIGNVVHGVDGRTCVNLGRCTFLGRPDQDGWIAWHGGRNPVPGVRVDVRLRDGREGSPQLSDQWDGCWYHIPGTTGATDIIAYRPHVASPASSSSVVQGDASGVDDFSEALLSLFFKHGLKVALEMSDIEALRLAALRPQPSGETREAVARIIPRWEICNGGVTEDFEVHADPAGEWVKYSDVEALLSPAAPDAGGGWMPADDVPMWSDGMVTDGERVARAQKAEADYGGFYWAVEDADGALEWEPTHFAFPPALQPGGER